MHKTKLRNLHAIEHLIANTDDPGVIRTVACQFRDYLPWFSGSAKAKIKRLVFDRNPEAKNNEAVSGIWVIVAGANASQRPPAYSILTADFKAFDQLLVSEDPNLPGELCRIFGGELGDLSYNAKQWLRNTFEAESYYPITQEQYPWIYQMLLDAVETDEEILENLIKEGGRRVYAREFKIGFGRQLKQMLWR